MIQPRVLALVVAGLAMACAAHAADLSTVDPKASVPLSPADTSVRCVTVPSRGYTLPDANCTPGAINPTLTLEVLQDPDYRTSMVRDLGSPASRKRTTYRLYGIKPPLHNTGSNQTCELDHVVSLELGGADTIDNIWPQCGPAGVGRNDRYFHQKDLVENYLAAQVRSGAIDLSAAQRGIAADWTQYLDEARAFAAP